jgi:hypothetical protein
MGDILQFKRPTLAEKHRGKSLCREGFHKWEVVTKSRFDVKQGKLVTIYQCSRCGAHKSQAH